MADHAVVSITLPGETKRVTLTVYRSPVDGVLVIELDTENLTDDECQRARVYMNDALAVWTHP